MRGLAQGLAALVLCLGSTAAAQTLELRVVEEGTGRPLAGVVVRLEQNGRPLVMGLSNDAGRLLLRAPAPGQYQVRAGRIGFQAPPPFLLELTSGTVQRQLEMPAQIRQLPTLTVSGTTQCDGRPTLGAAAAALWEEVQLALTANRITVEQGLQVVHAVRFERYLSSSRSLLRERVTGSMVTSGQPFVSVPADQLARQGYVTTKGDSVVYSAPDAALLLTDEFVRTHCFDVNPRSRDLVGLSFEPVPGLQRADVAGTLWIDRETRELRHLEYRYTGLPASAGPGRDPGGEIHFQRLPSGSWIVREWAIRMPRTAERRNAAYEGPQLVITGWLEQGGRSSVTSGAQPGANQGSLVEGETFDSLHQTPLVGAVITIDGEPDSARTDSAGRFRLSSRSRGSRLLRATHPLLGIVSDHSTQAIRLVPGQSTQVRIDVPSATKFARTLCGSGENAHLVGVATGTDGTPLSSVRIRAAYTSISDRGVTTTRSLTVESGPRGVFALCDLPGGWQARVELLDPDDKVLGTAQVKIAPREAVWVDLRQP